MNPLANAWTPQSLQYCPRFVDNSKNPSSLRTVGTGILPGSTRQPPKRSRRYRLHAKGVNLNGRLAIEASRYRETQDMEEYTGPTQPATQPYLDRRREGQSSMSVEDESDIICILQPVNPPAYEVVNVVAEVTPQHILQNHNLGWKHEDDMDLEPLEDLEVNNNRPPNISTSKEIALRLSSKVKDLCMGFVFGRDPTKCDIVIELPYEKRRISGMHFRIFVNEEGIIMLEDTSTNGTLVEGKLLKCKDPKPESARQMHMISKGSTVELILGPTAPTVKFNVTIPSRDRGEFLYHQKLREYLDFVKMANFQAQAKFHTVPNRHPLALPLLPANAGRAIAEPLTIQEILPFEGSTATMLTAGSTAFNCGAHWNGGEKYNVIEHIGKGAFADVYKFATKSEGKVYAVKEVEKRKFIKEGVLDHKVNNELRIMKSLDHPHIIKYVDYEDRPQHLFIIMEFVHHGDLSKYLQALGSVQESPCQSVTRQLCHALRYLHNCRITHRDIKPDNILIASLDPFVVKLSDFGLSKVIKDDETFLKTFCGTLLYCAPEVYPEYDHYMRGETLKRYRNGETPLKTSPYSSAVDMWSLAAVIFHLLCNKPPYKGSSENRGALMLRTIMENRLDVGPLRRSGVSPFGINLLEKLLVVDPSERPNAKECLLHPWLRDIDDITPIEEYDDQAPEGLARIQEEEEVLDASQLSIHDGDSARNLAFESVDGVSEVDELDYARVSKRQRTHQVLAGQQQDHALLSDFATPILPLYGHPDALQVHQNQSNRLFGEIGASDLQSSGVLSHGAHVALQLSTEGNLSVESSSGPEDSSEIFSPRVSQHQLVPQNSIRQLHDLSYQHPVGSAPSLLGAEAQIGQLNMASPDSGVSTSATPKTPGTPKSRRNSPSPGDANDGLKQSSQILLSASKDNTPKRSEVAGTCQSSPTVPTYWERDDNSLGHNLEDAPQANGRDSIVGKQAHVSKSRSSSVSDDNNAKNVVQADDEKSDNLTLQKQKRLSTSSQVYSRKRSGSIQQVDVKVHVLPIPMNPGPTKLSTEGDGGNSGKIEAETPAQTIPPTDPHPRTSDILSVSNAKATSPDTFLKPATRMGKLTTVPGSVISNSFSIEQRLTSWGRDPESTYVYPNSMDTRVPKAAMDILLWRPGIERELQNGADWAKMPDICAIISTRCSKYIFINEVPLTTSKGDGWLYGILRQGDIITIFENPTAFLKFRCEFYFGLSREPRADGEKFVVEKEVEKFQAYMSRRASPADFEHVATQKDSNSSCDSLSSA